MDAILMTARFRLAELLEEAGLSQRELASRSGVSPTIVNRMVGNLARQVSLATLDKISATLGKALGQEVAPGDLIERERKWKRG
jgi:transcriptional regulator with XRE-family HTH domain